MLKPLRSKSQSRGPVSTPVFLAGPTEGWYVGTNISEAPPKTAYILDNAFPGIDYIRLRGGSQEWASGIGAAAVIDSLLTWTDGLNPRMFACTGGSIYDVSSSGVVGAAVVSGLAIAELEAVQFTGTGGQFLVAANGSDPLQLFNGTVWNPRLNITATPSIGLPTLTAVSSFTNISNGQSLSGPGIPAGAAILSFNVGAGTITMTENATAGAALTPVTVSLMPPVTGLTGNQLSQIWVYKNRIYGIEKNSLNAWYLPLDSIGGAATVFPLSSVFSRGGHLLCGGTWALPTINGLFESCVFVSTEGEVAVYTGLYPGGTDWSKQGIYKISKPLGQRCLLNTGGDLLIMTEDGIVPMSKVETLDQQALQNIALTQRIMPAWTNAVSTRAGMRGWQATLWPLQSMAVVNLPKSSPEDKTQFVANSRTGAWCRYTGWDANCFAVWNNQLFYGTSDGRVMQAETGASDDGQPYTFTVFPSFSHLNAIGTRKHVKLVKPQLQANFFGTIQLTMRVDYDPFVPAAPAASLASSSLVARWDIAVWDQDTWPHPLYDQSYWTTASGLGEVVSPVVQVTVNSIGLTPDLRLTGFQILAERGNPIG